jgi:hypothetical protein
MSGIDPLTQTRTSTQIIGDGLTYSVTNGAIAKEVLQVAFADFHKAYANASAREVTDIGKTDIGGLTLSAGTYHFGAHVAISSHVYLKGNADDVSLAYAPEPQSLACASLEPQSLT